MSKLKLSCKEANHICDKSQYKEANFWEKIKLNIHLLYCDVCRKYSTRNAKLTELIKTDKIEVMDTEAKAKLKVTFEQELAKHQ
jgi:predicted anti-sigma-YlaC factor YlaD